VKLHCEHEIPLLAEEFWSTLHAPHYEAKVREVTGLCAYEERARREDPQHVYGRIRVEAELPALVAGVAGDASAGHVEEQWHGRSRMEVRWLMTPRVLADRARIEGVVRIEPRGKERCVRILDGVVELCASGVGGPLERAVVSRVADA